MSSQLSQVERDLIQGIRILIIESSGEVKLKEITLLALRKTGNTGIIQKPLMMVSFANRTKANN